MVDRGAVLLDGFPSPRTCGALPVILSEYVQEKKLILLPGAIRNMTSFPSKRLARLNVWRG